MPAGAKPALKPLTLAATRAKAARTGGPIAAEVSLNAQGAGPGFGAHLCDVEVDPETGHVTMLRYTAAQDVGRAIHPTYVEGQIQGGAAQGIGWALNEEYIFDAEGRMENAGFLDYRVPVASDLPMIDAIMVEVPNPRHPFGAKAWARCRSCRRWRRSPTPSAPRSGCACATCRCRRRRSAPRWTLANGDDDADVSSSGRGLPPFTGGQAEFDVAATTLRRLMLELEQRFPGLGEHVEAAWRSPSTARSTRTRIPPR